MMLYLRLAFAPILVVSAMARQSLGDENPEQPSKTPVCLFTDCAGNGAGGLH